VIFRRLFALLLTVALTFAPLGMPAMAEAAPPAASHHGKMAGQTHCDEQPQQPDPHHKAADKSCCAAMCVGVVVLAGAAELADYHPLRERPVSDLDRRGFLGEIATPPPRAA
jgi:hypothetical protein